VVDDNYFVFFGVSKMNALANYKAIDQMLENYSLKMAFAIH